MVIILLGVRWNLRASLSCVFLLAPDANTASCMHWPFVLPRTVCLARLVIAWLLLIISLEVFAQTGSPFLADE